MSESAAPASRLTLLLTANLAGQSGVAGAGGLAGWSETIARLLQPQGVETIYARSGYEALELIDSLRVHVAVLDQQMPQLCGLQVIRMMREKHAATAGTSAPIPPAILLADNLTGQLMQEALLQNVFSVLPKPVDYSALLDATARALRRFHQSSWPAAWIAAGTGSGPAGRNN